MYADNTYHYEPDLLALFWETDGQGMLLTVGYLPTDLESLRTKLMCHALFDSALSPDPLKEKRGVQFIHPSFRDYFVASELQEAALYKGDKNKALSLLRRPIPDGLLEILCWREQSFQRLIHLLLQQKETGLRNAISLLSLAIETANLSPSTAEVILTESLGSKRFEHADLSGMRLQ